MGFAKKCDICGKLYEIYNFQKSTNKPNGFMLLNIDHAMNYFKSPICACCPECMNSIMEHIKSLKKMEEC